MTWCVENVWISNNNTAKNINIIYKQKTYFRVDRGGSDAGEYAIIKPKDTEKSVKQSDISYGQQNDNTMCTLKKKILI